MLDVQGETRKHLLAFLHRVLDGSVTRNELENFMISGYQTELFENIRIKVVKIISGSAGTTQLSKIALSASDRASIEAFIAELE